MEMMMQPIDMMLEEMIRNDYLYNNTIYLNYELDRDTQVKFTRQLEKLCEKELLKPEKERNNVKIKITSYGGSAYGLFAIISKFEHYQEKGIVIETHVDGFTASAGSKIAMAGSKGHRYITRYGRMLVHQTQLYKRGYSTLQEEIKGAEDCLKDWDTVKEIFKKHSKLTDEDIENFTEKNIDFTYNSKECVEKGFIDHIV